MKSMITVALACIAATGLLPPQSISSISLEKYLLGFKFEGTYIGDVNLTGKARKGSHDGQQGRLASLKFWPARGPGNGRYTMMIGTHSVSGEWNIVEGTSSVNLWIDTVGKYHSRFPNVLTFRPPRFVDDYWVALDYTVVFDALNRRPTASPFPLTGKLLMVNRPDTKYWRQPNGGTLGPSRTRILVPGDSS